MSDTKPSPSTPQPKTALITGTTGQDRTDRNDPVTMHPGYAVKNYFE
jgi:hypothetical protein